MFLVAGLVGLIAIVSNDGISARGGHHGGGGGHRGGGGWHGGGHRGGGGHGGHRFSGGGHHGGGRRFAGHHGGHGRRGFSHGWRGRSRGWWSSYWFWAPFWVGGFYFLDPFNPFWGTPVQASFGFEFGNPWFYPRFGIWHHRGWNSWYYPWNRCWYYPSLSYWHYPSYGYSVYYDRTPIVQEGITYRSLLVENTESVPMYYAVYWTPKTKVVGQDVRLYQLTQPELIKGNSKTKILVPQATSKRDRIVIMAKDRNDLKEQLSKDATDNNNVVIPVDNNEKERIAGDNDAYNTVREVDVTERDAEQLSNVQNKVNKVVKQKENMTAIEEKIQAAGDKYKKEQPKESASKQPAGTPVVEVK